MNTNTLIVKERLDKMNVNYDLFEPILKADTTVISGGLITQILTDLEWKTDIDIFTTDKEVLTYFKEKRFIPTPLGINYGSSYNVYRFSVNKNITVDIIIVLDLMKAIGNFDLDFCKCWFDGEDFNVINSQSILTKTHDRPHLNKTCNLEERIAKYRKRGFTIDM